jgi:hypothetical protein
VRPRQTGTHAAEATFRRIVYAFAPNYELRFKSKTQGGGLDCRVWPQGAYEQRDKIGSLMIDPHGNIVYAPRQVKWLLNDETFAPPKPVITPPVNPRMRITVPGVDTTKDDVFETI